MTYEETLARIDSIRRFGPKPGLELIRALLKRLGDPQDRLKFVHVAGTNGKGTTCTLISSVLKAAGYRTGLYLSPHVSDFRERIQVGGEMIGRGELASLAERVFPQAETMRGRGESVSQFEAITAMAFLYFAERGCDIVVLEVGLGGRLDATNVIKTPLVSVITSISLDHTELLGDTVERIAYEKCGIIKEGGVTVCSPDQKPGAEQVVRRVAGERRNRFVSAASAGVRMVSSDLSGTELLWRGVPLRLPFLGEHQVGNAETALAAAEALRSLGWSIPDSAVRRGFSSASFPARLEVLSRSPLVLLDGAHNPGGTAALAAAVRRYLSGRETVAVMGMLADKDIDAALRNLAGLFSHVVTVAPNGPRALPARELAARWNRLGTPAEAARGDDEALRRAAELLGPGGAVLICGSLYLAGDLRERALKFFGTSPGPAGPPSRNAKN